MSEEPIDWLSRIAESYTHLRFQKNMSVGALTDHVEGITPENRAMVLGMCSIFVQILTDPQALDLIIDSIQPVELTVVE